MNLQPDGGRRSHPQSKERRRAIVLRRRRVAELRAAGITDADKIARTLGCSPATVYNDLQALDVEWRKQAADLIAAERALDLARLDAMIGAAWAKARAGNLFAIDRVLAAIRLRSRLIGTEAPPAIDLTPHVRVLAAASGLSEAEAAAIAERIIREFGYGAA